MNYEWRIRDVTVVPGEVWLHVDVGKTTVYHRLGLVGGEKEEKAAEEDKETLNVNDVCRW